LVNYNELKLHIKKCKVGRDSNKINQCYDYCGYFHLNSYSPVLEGYNILFENMIIFLIKFSEKF